MKCTLALLLICVFGIDAFTYTCEDVKKFIRDRTEINGRTACVALGENIITDEGFAANVYLADANGHLRYTLAQAASSINGCVSSSDSVWTIVVNDGEEGNNIDCTDEFTILFSSIDAKLVAAKSSAQFYQTYHAYNLTVVAPNGGLLVDFSCSNTEEPLHFYTGLGNGAAEEMYYYGSSKCDERLSIFAWDTAVTINVPEEGYIILTYWSTGPYLSLGSVSYEVLLMGSGKSSNVIQHSKEDKFMKLTPTISEDLKFHIDGFAEMDEKLGNSLTFSTECTANNCKSTTVPITDRDVHLILGADILTVKYDTKVPADQWKDDDLFFMRIASTPLDSTDAPPTVAPPKPNTDYSCGCNLTEEAEFAPNIWLDIVFVIDVSMSMGSKNLKTINTMIDSMVSMLTLENSGKQQYSRVGLVTVSSGFPSSAQIVADFNMPFPSPMNLQPNTETYTSYVTSDGMAAALKIFSNSPSRSARQLIYVIAAVESSGFVNAGVQPFKDNGGVIAVTDISRNSGSLIDLCTPGYFTVLLDGNADMQLLCDANCFCPMEFTPYSTDDEQYYTRQEGDRGCFKAQPTSIAYEMAKDFCQSEGSLISTIHDDDMQNFVLTQLTGQVGPKKPYWIGYEYNGKEWQWVDDSTSPYSKWAADQPDPKGGRCAYSMQTTGFNTAWFAGDCSTDKYFVCERAACSVSNYCH